MVRRLLRIYGKPRRHGERQSCGTGYIKDFTPNGFTSGLTPGGTFTPNLNLPDGGDVRMGGFGYGGLGLGRDPKATYGHYNYVPQLKTPEAMAQGIRSKSVLDHALSTTDMDPAARDAPVREAFRAGGEATSERLETGRNARARQVRV